MADPLGAASLLVTQPGNTTFQDLGRFGSERIGLSVNGALDQWSAQEANILVGNHRGAVLFEVTAFDFAFEALSDLLIAVTGAGCDLVVDGLPRPESLPVPVRRGQQVAVTNIREGMRVYLAVNGSIDAPKLADSAAPDPIVGFAQRLSVGDVVTIHSDFRDFVHPIFGLPLFRFSVPQRKHDAVWPITITPATETNELQNAVAAFAGILLTITPQSDSVGLRLSGPAIARTTAGELVSRGVPVGGVELLPDGNLIILHRGRYVTAGYPVIAVVTSSALSQLGQAHPGQQLEFVWQSRQEAVNDHRRRIDMLDDLERRVHVVFTDLGLPFGAKSGSSLARTM